MADSMSDIEDAMPDDAATREALAELERLDAADAPEPRLVANPPPPRAYANPANRPLPPPPEDKPFWHDGPSEKAPRVGKISSLEDLCTSQPGLADGQVFLRIDRKEPKMVRGVRTAGFIKDIHGTLTTPEFAEMFGGGKYAITAVRVGDDGNFRSAGQIEVQVQGNPTPDTLPEENDMTSAGRAAAPVYGGEPAQVAVERMRVDERREERFREALRPPDALIEAVGKTNDRAIQMVSDKSNALIEVLRAQTDAAMDAAAKKDDEIRELRFRISELDRQLADAKHHTETEEIKRIREAKDNELRRITEDHSRTVERISNDARNSIAEEQRRHTDERSRIIADNTREFERERAAAQLRENQIRTDYERAEKLMKESFDGRLRDAQDRATVSMAEQKASYERQLDAIKSLEKGRADTAEKFADFKTTTASQELA
ncbi:MAG: hypothetical protein LUO93_07720, partial [Methanomicrobiales archaeon]|nr:hypothetical protein [Methanomicrobiales archaeon]